MIPLLLLLAAGPAIVESRFASRDVPLEADPNSAFWRGASTVSVDWDNFGKPRKAHGTELRSRWTPDNLYFLFTCHYEELYLHPNPSLTSETNMLWEWDVAEVFLGSDFSNIRRYREFEMSPQGEWIDLDIDLARPHPADAWTWNSGFAVRATVDQPNKTWYGAMRIPYKSVDPRRPAAGNLLRFNFYREQGPPPRRVEIAWQPTMQRSFHAPEKFGTLKLVR